MKCTRALLHNNAPIGVWINRDGSNNVLKRHLESDSTQRVDESSENATAPLLDAAGEAGHRGVGTELDGGGGGGD